MAIYIYIFVFLTVDVRVNLREPQLIPRGFEVNNSVKPLIVLKRLEPVTISRGGHGLVNLTMPLKVNRLSVFILLFI